MVDNAVINERGGAKADAGKTRYDLLVPEFIEGMANVMTFGSTKYSDWNWVNLEKKRIVASLFRHIMAYLKGEELDPETQLKHLYHAGCNLMMLNGVNSNVAFVEYEQSEETPLHDNKLYNTYVCVRGVLRYITMTSNKLNSDVFSNIDLKPSVGKLILEDIDNKNWNKYSLENLRYIFKMSMEYLQNGRQENKVNYHKGLYRAFQNRVRTLQSYSFTIKELAEYLEMGEDTLYKMCDDLDDQYFEYLKPEEYAQKIAFTYSNPLS